MKQFSLDEFKKNPNRKVVAENGRSARIICTDAKGRFPVIALVFDVENDYEDIYFYTPDGECSDISDGSMNLFFAPENIDGWVNIYKQSEDYIRTGAVVFKTKEEAMKHINGTYYITTIHIEWEE